MIANPTNKSPTDDRVLFRIGSKSGHEIHLFDWHKSNGETRWPSKADAQMFTQPSFFYSYFYRHFPFIRVTSRSSLRTQPSLRISSFQISRNVLRCFCKLPYHSVLIIVSSWLFLAEKNLNKNVREMKNYLKSMVDGEPVNGWMVK